MDLKRIAAKEALNHIDGLVKYGRIAINGEDKLIFGLGTGSTVAEFWKYFCDWVVQNKFRCSNIVIIPTSLQSRNLISNSKLEFQLGDPEYCKGVDLLVDGFDELDCHNLSMIKGGGAAHLMEKLVSLNSKYKIYIGTEDKVSEKLGLRGTAVPIEVARPLASYAKEQLRRYGEPYLRECTGGKIGPIVTDLGNVVIDLFIPKKSLHWNNLEGLDKNICGILGVLGTGIFIDSCDCAIIAKSDGTGVHKISKDNCR